MNISEINLSLLSLDEKSALKALFSSKDYSIIDSHDPLAKYAFTLAAFSDDTPIGLIHSYVYSEIKEAHLSHFFVALGLRDKGLRTQLMEQFLKELKKKEIHFVTYRFDAKDQALKRILQKTNWAPPQLLTRRYFFQSDTFKPSWFTDSHSLPKTYSVFNWKDATKEDIEIAKQWEKSNPQIAQYSPFNNLYPVDNLTSLGLKKEGKLAGWLINHRLQPKLLSYSAFYLIPEARGNGPALNLLQESIRRHIASEPDLIGSIEINFKLSSRSWIRFIERNLAPFATHFEDINYSFHTLKKE